jgi:bifunctional non-homologous end joining protein LigD
MDRRELIRKLIRPDKRSAIQFSDHVEGDGAAFFKAAAELGLEGIVSKRMASRYFSRPSRSWLKVKTMVGSEFILLGTDRDASGIPWALLASDRDDELKFAGPAILHPAKAQREIWSQQMAALAVAKPPLEGLSKARLSGFAPSFG